MGLPMSPAPSGSGSESAADALRDDHGLDGRGGKFIERLGVCGSPLESAADPEVLDEPAFAACIEAHRVEKRNPARFVAGDKTLAGGFPCGVDSLLLVHPLFTKNADEVARVNEGGRKACERNAAGSGPEGFGGAHDAHEAEDGGQARAPPAGDHGSGGACGCKSRSRAPALPCGPPARESRGGYAARDGFCCLHCVVLPSIMPCLRLVPSASSRRRA